MTPYFSAIVPTYHRAILLQRALSSINAQSARNKCEVIVVSDVSERNTSSICHDLLLEGDTYIIRNGVKGPSESRNLGIQIAKGEYLLFLDDDDAWHENFLELLYQRPEVRNGIFVHFDGTVVKEHREKTHFSELKEMPADFYYSDHIFVRNQIHMSTLAFPRRLIGDSKFDPHMRAYEDWDFMLAIFLKEAPVYIPVLGSRIYEVFSGESDRRGESQAACDYNAALDYLYVYRRRQAPTEEIKSIRSVLLQKAGLSIEPEYL